MGDNPSDRYFVRDRLLVEIAYQKRLKDNQSNDVFQLLEPHAFQTRLEADFHCRVWRENHGRPAVLKPGRCPTETAWVLLKSDAAYEHLPVISFISAQPVYTLVDAAPAAA
jgi:hypothetical protein